MKLYQSLIWPCWPYQHSQSFSKIFTKKNKLGIKFNNTKNCNGIIRNHKIFTLNIFVDQQLAERALQRFLYSGSEAQEKYQTDIFTKSEIWQKVL